MFENVTITLPRWQLWIYRLSLFTVVLMGFVEFVFKIFVI
jgi:hypothetical protein